MLFVVFTNFPFSIVIKRSGIDLIRGADLRSLIFVANSKFDLTLTQISKNAEKQILKNFISYIFVHLYVFISVIEGHVFMLRCLAGFSE